MQALADVEMDDTQLIKKNITASESTYYSLSTTIEINEINCCAL